MSFLLFLIIGALAGFIAGKLMRGQDFGLLKNMLLGIIGAMVGGFLAGLIGLQGTGLVAELLIATAGAALILFVFSRRR